MEFQDWLVNEKKYLNRSARDVLSRIKRIKNILNVETIDVNTERNLKDSEEFLKLSCSVKSQLRIAVRIYLEYKGENHD